MTDPKTKQAILKMREDGASYAEIADFFSLSPNTVKSICYRNGVHAPLSNGAETGLCKNCGKPLSHPTGGGRKIFCSNRCRYQWWNHFRSRQPIPSDLLLLRKRIRQLREQEKAILRQGMLSSQPLWGGIAVMDKAHFEQIKQYGAMLAIAGHLHERGLITDAERRKLTAKLQKKYRPAVGSAAGFSPALNNLTEKVPGKEDLDK